MNETWTSPLDRQHPLVGRVYRTATNAFATPDDVFAAAQEASFVLLGEKHDNSDHHRLQARVVAHVLAGKPKAAVAFEMLEFPEQPALDAYVATHPNDAEGLGAAVEWADKGWPAWSMYAPIAAHALRVRAPIIAANLPRASVMQLARQGADAPLAQELHLPPLPEDQQRELEQELFESHCRHMPLSMMGGMALAQIARDATMASRLLEADRGQGAVLIAGNGHVRMDRGVPWHLALARRDASVLSVAFIEVVADHVDPSDYATESGHRIYDFVWFTPRLDDADPCAAFTE